MTNKADYTFLVGAPGSRWSGVGQIITENYDYNTEDETSWRLYKHGDFTGHKGAYFGPSMELGHNFHRLESTYGKDVDAFLRECDKAWDGRGTGTKMIKCHQFAYNLGWLRRNVSNANILLVRRGNQECFDWWKQAGGWAENKLATEFVARRADWETFNERWLSLTFGPHNVKLDPEKYADVQVALVTL
jgi:hypothetical protein